MYSLQVLQTTEELNCHMTLLMNWKNLLFPSRARSYIYTSFSQLHFSRQPNPERVGCSKSMIFFCTVFDLDKEAFY